MMLTVRPSNQSVYASMCNVGFTPCLYFYLYLYIYVYLSLSLSVFLFTYACIVCSYVRMCR